MKQRSRRDFLKAGGLAVVTTAGMTALAMEKNKPAKIAENRHASQLMQQDRYGDLPGPVGEVDHEKTGLILFSVLVASGKTLFPICMAAVNPVILTILWLLLKRILPQVVRDYTEGAGFNIAFLSFFARTTVTLWNF